ncbi:MAG: thioredoxin family protein [Candidatus Thorarchaeota archaeon]|nr:thioredoxin family protein [Candidatus Thorarchaeota archaeon]
MSEDAQWEKAIEYTKFLKGARENVESMKARYTDLQITEQDLEHLRSLQNDLLILVIGTERCSDTAGNMPILAKMADISSKIQLRILDSDANATYHQQFKVNGKMKTPVVLFLNPKHEELCRWVERPNAAYKVINEATNPSLESRTKELKKLYSDPEIQRQSVNEFMDLILRADFISGRS